MKMLILTIIIAAMDLIPAIKKKQGKEAVVLILLGAITLSYGYYYNTHKYTASLVDILFGIFNIQ